ncbi:MAG: AraC family transcriptional regulator [Clostridium sp.]|nr:AraC family transcriptional regulator [Clostridium sp.]
MEQQPSILKEIRPHGTKSFPCAIYRTHSIGKGTLVKHHWHDEVEILYFSGGKFRLEINMESFSIQSECLYFINPGELHSIITETADSHWEDAVVFSPDILSFDSYDEAQIHLIKPILNGRLLFPRYIAPEHPSFKPIRKAFMDIMRSFGQPVPDISGQAMQANASVQATQPDASTQAPQTVASKQATQAAPPALVSADSSLVTDDLTSQLYIKSSLLYILAVLSDYKLFTPTEKNLDKRVEIIKTALTYIKENYQEKIYIADLARQVNLNEQYFCRLFKKAIGRSPIEYINEYRIKQTRRLLEETNLPVTEICLECGYSNLGNFLREFRKYTGTTPLQYRIHL